MTMSPASGRTGSTMGLTPRQADCLAFIRRRAELGIVSPSYDEIGAELGIVKSNVNRLVHGLIERGYLRQLPNRRRSVTLVEPGLSGNAESVLAYLSRTTGRTRDQLVAQAIEEFALRQVSS